MTLLLLPHLLEFFEGVGAEGDPALNGFAGDGAEPGGPAGCDVFALHVLVEVPQPEAERVAIGTRSPRLTYLALTRSTRLGPLLAPLLLRLGQTTRIAPERAGVVNRRRHRHRLLRAHAPHGSGSGPRQPDSKNDAISLRSAFFFNTSAKKERKKVKRRNSISGTQKENVALCFFSAAVSAPISGDWRKRDLMR